MQYFLKLSTISGYFPFFHLQNFNFKAIKYCLGIAKSLDSYSNCSQEDFLSAGILIFSHFEAGHEMLPQVTPSHISQSFFWSYLLKSTSETFQALTLQITLIKKPCCDCHTSIRNSAFIAKLEACMKPKMHVWMGCPRTRPTLQNLLEAIVPSLSARSSRQSCGKCLHRLLLSSLLLLLFFLWNLPLFLVAIFSYSTY